MFCTLCVVVDILYSLRVDADVALAVLGIAVHPALARAEPPADA
jgi:hypothetical protein